MTKLPYDVTDLPGSGEADEPFGPLDDEYSGFVEEEPGCDGCVLDPDLTDVELRSTPCGLTLCSDCAFEHRDCPQCADQIAQDHGCDLGHRDRDEGRS
jgi:hypothetical protein